MVFEKVQTLLAEALNIDDPKSITMESNIVQDLEADSLDMVELLMSLEDEFGVSVPDDMANELVTVSAIVNFIESQGKQFKLYIQRRKANFAFLFFVAFCKKM